MTTGSINAVSPAITTSSGAISYCAPADDYFGLYNNYNNTAGSVFNTGSMMSGMMNYYGNSTQQIQQYYNMNAQQQGYMNMGNVQNADIAKQCTAISTVISQGQEDQVMAEYNQLVDAIRNQPGNQMYTESQIKSLADSAYYNATGKTLTDVIEQNCDSSFETGFNIINPFDNDKTSKEELIAELNGTKVKDGTGAAKVAGNAAGGAAAAGVIGAGIGTLICPGPGTLIGAGVGAVVGAVGGLIKGLFS